MITNDTTSPSLKNNTETPPIQTTLTGWVLPSLRKYTPLDGIHGATEYHKTSHNKVIQADPPYMKEPHSKGPDKNLGVNYITNTGNDTGLTVVDIATTNQISNTYTHQGASRTPPHLIPSRRSC